MLRYPLHKRVLSLALTALLGALLLGAFTGSPPAIDLAAASSATLRQRFPAQAADILDAGVGFARAPQGFVSRTPASGGRFRPAGEPIEAVLPLRADMPWTFRTASGHSVRVRELGAAGAATPEGRAVSYARPGGRAYWSAGAASVEEWLSLEAGQLRGDGPVAVWTVEGAELRQAGDAVAVTDRSGRERMRVSAPRAYAESGRLLRARLVVRARRIELWVEASAEAALIDPRWEATGSLMAPRNAPTATRLQNGDILIAGGLGLTDAELYHPATGMFEQARDENQSQSYMQGIRDHSSETLLPGGDVLIAGGSDGAGYPQKSAELFAPGKGFSPLGVEMNDARSEHTAIRLPSGKVLLAGGKGLAKKPQKSAETFDSSDPNHPAFKPTKGEMTEARSGHTATLLSDGRVLVAGGIGVDGAPLATAELYDPTADTWAPAGSMSIGRIGHTATRLPGGRVLVASGTATGGAASSSAEIYDPVSGSWSPVAPLKVARKLHTATLLPDGKVLVTGGIIEDGSAALSSAELFDPATSSWQDTASMLRGRRLHTATLLSNDLVLVAGGPEEAELYDPSSVGSWVRIAPPSTDRPRPEVALLAQGRVMVSGNAGAPAVDVYDPAAGAWRVAGTIERQAHTSTPLRDGSVLIAGGFAPGGVALKTAARFDPLTGKSPSVAEMHEARALHTATSLGDKDNRVLVAGGVASLQGQGQQRLKSVEIFNQGNETWSQIEPMSKERSGHTATLLGNTTVLVTGGKDAQGIPISAAEFYDPVRKSWLSAGSMTAGRDCHSATLLADGRVLVAGGNYERNAEIYDPARNEWSATKSTMHHARFCHSATLLPSGQVLVAGGREESSALSGLSAAELYDPEHDSWTEIEAMNDIRHGHAAVLLPNGKVLVVNGQGAAASAELYDPGAYWASGGVLATSRTDHTMTALAGGSALIAGGSGDAFALASVERYDSAKKTWTSGRPMKAARAGHTASALAEPAGGAVIVAGGFNDSGPLDAVEQYDPGADAWTPLASMSEARSRHTATLLSDGRLLVAGGWGGKGATAGAEVYDPAKNQWTAKAGAMTAARWKHSATRLASGLVLVAGGWGANGVLASAELYDPDKLNWKAAGDMDFARAGHTATRLEDGRVLIAGGLGGNGPLARAEVFDPGAKKWTSVKDMLHPRTGHVAVLLNGRVLVAGGLDEDGPVAGAEMYDPSSDVWSPIRSLRAPRRDAAAALLTDGQVLASGGLGGAGLPLASAELFALAEGGAQCALAADCDSRFCVDGVCCNSACDASDCQGCSAVRGAAKPGTCTDVSGRACDDHDACTQSDTCQKGECEGSEPKVCAPFACIPESGKCLEACTSVEQCAEDFVCNREHDCIARPDNKPPAGGGCHIAPHGAPDRSSGAGAALSLMGLIALAFRRRAGGGPKGSTMSRGGDSDGPERSGRRRAMKWAAFFVGATMLAAAGEARAAPALRVQVIQRGDAVLIGNTLGLECAPGTPAPIVGMVGSCGNMGIADSAPDIFWRADSPAPGQAEANTSITAAQARSSAVLTLPPGATVTHAFLYWAATLAAPGADPTATLDRPGGFTQNVTALGPPYLSANNSYQSVADVTSIVQANGPGVYRVGGVDAAELVNANNSNLFAGWWMAVFYTLPDVLPRELALFDGLDIILSGAPQSTVVGLNAPAVAYVAKLGIVTFDGDNTVMGDSLYINGGAPLSDALNPPNNFFNGTRSYLGNPFSVPGDLPQLTGGPQSMAGMDIDEVDITSRMNTGDASLTVQAVTTSDQYYLAGFITSIPTSQPDFLSSQKTALDLDGGALLPEDLIAYTIVATNTGNDGSVNTVMSDPLPFGVTYNPNSIQIKDGANAGAKTDAAGDDQCEYDGSTVTCRLGAGADHAQGGVMPASFSTTMTFTVTVDAGAQGTIANQATITAAGLKGSPSTATPTDGNGLAPGSPPTEIVIDNCATDSQCAAPLAHCDVSLTPNTCVGCLVDAHCPGSAPTCDFGTCVCVPAGSEICDNKDNDCNGLIDDNVTGQPCATGLPGICNEGMILSCSGGKITCEPNVFPGQAWEICNGQDDDCDGEADEGSGGGEPCDTGLPGICNIGKLVSCKSGAGTCVPIVAPGDFMEVCNQLDDDCDGAADNIEGCHDSDSDGLADELEDLADTNRFDADSDDDGVPDGLEKLYDTDGDGDGKINALDYDSDGDGLPDGLELGFDCEGPGTDVSAGHCVPDADKGATITDPLHGDTDGGGKSDSDEDTNKNGAIDTGESDPTAGHGADDLDSDKDGLNDEEEALLGTAPDDADSDDDGVKDGDELKPAEDSDGDGIINALDPDSDNDFLWDGTELGSDCSSADTDKAAKHCIADADKGATTTDPLDADTDHGGVKDGDEDLNGNGVVDPEEKDPTKDHGADDLIANCQGDEDCGPLDGGIVCDGDICRHGCRGASGNGCPVGFQCSSASAKIGECEETGLDCLHDSDCGGPQSGRICEYESFTCVAGCRQDGGNGCPEGQECNDKNACEALPDDDGPVPPGGCACRAARSRGSIGDWLAAALVVVVSVLRRRAPRRDAMPSSFR